MNRGNDNETDSLPVIVEEQIDKVCLDFESAWKAGRPLQIKECLGKVSAEHQTALLRELLLLELEYRREAGEVPIAEEYLRRFPDHADIIRGAFEADHNDQGASLDPEPPETVSQDATPRHQRTTYSVGQKIGRYTVIRKIGEGGFAVVYLARDDELQRQVAIKVPHFEKADTGDAVERFLTEARTAARLKHPGIVAVHDVGRQEDGTPFVVMDYIEGCSLAQRIRLKKPSAAEAASLLAGVAEAAHYAHKRGFVHRDLKPANILLDEDGRPHIADFGLAVHERAQHSRVGDHSGTPAYMAPEQVRGDAHRLDGRTDIWAIGGVLYELLTGRRPFRGGSREELAEEILQRDPKPPRQIADNVPIELERICLRCLAKDVTERYSTAADLARALRHWQHPRRRLLIGLAAAAAVVLVIVALVIANRPPQRDVPTVSSQLAALSGTIDVWVWNAEDESRRRLTLHDYGTLPLRPGDQIRVEAALNRPAYVYLLLIDSEGQVAPIYPWKPGDWSQRPQDEKPVDRLSLPGPADQGWWVKPPYGTETFVLLARDEPVPADLDVEGILAGFPRQQVHDLHRAIWFADGQPLSKATDRLRGIDVTETATIDDSLLQIQRLIQEKVGPHFELNRAVSFASRGEGE